MSIDQSKDKPTSPVDVVNDTPPMKDITKESIPEQKPMTVELRLSRDKHSD